MKKTSPTVAPDARGRERSQQSLVEQYGVGIAASFRRISLLELFPNLRSIRKRTPGRLHAITTAVLDEYLSSGGWYATIEEGVYDVTYLALPKMFADLKHAAILKEIERQIQEQFGGTPSPTGLRLSHELSRKDFEAMHNGPRPTVVLNLDIPEILFGAPGEAKMLSKRIGQTVREVLEEFLAISGFYTRLSNAQILLIFPETSRPLAEMKRDSIANEIARRLKTVGAKKDAPGKGRADPADDPRAPGRSLFFRTKPSAALVKTWNLAVAEAAGKRGQFDPDEARAMPSGWSWSYQPLWRIRNRLLTAYVLRGVPPSVDKYRKVARDSPFKEILVPADQPGPIDLPLLDVAIRDLHRTMNQGRQGIVIVPVRFATLDRTSMRTLYLHICSQLPEDVRKYLVPEIVGVPPDLVTFRLEERINQLRPFSRAILIRASLADQRFRQWRTFGLHAVGIDMSQYLGAEADIMRGLEEFAAAAEDAKLHTYAYGIPSLSLTTATVVSGIDYVGSDMIAPPTRQPLQVAEFDTEMLYPGSEPTAADDAP